MTYCACCVDNDCACDGEAIRTETATDWGGRDWLAILRAVSALHVRGQKAGAHNCAECGYAWPCPTAELIGTLPSAEPAQGWRPTDTVYLPGDSPGDGPRT